MLLVRADDRVLHEFVPSPSEDEGTLLVAQEGAEPAAIVVRGEVVPPPEAGALSADERPMRAQPGDGAREEQPGRRSSSFRPDRITDLESTLHYFEVFSPAIAPYKRVTALDVVTLSQDGVTPVLGIARPQPRVAVPVEGASAPAPDARPRDKFWGTVVLEFDGGTTLPLPSVAPDSRVLTLRSEPEALLRVERDSADNFYVVAAAPIRGEVRLTFLMDAPRGYFSMPLSRQPVDARAAEVFPLPAGVQRRAVLFAAEHGLRRGMPFAEAVGGLVAHFRAFEESATPPADSGDIFLDLARGMKGVCRHRAYAFVIVAHALGIPARFVQNEAHAWVEVKQPDAAGWLRIDLGGAADGLEAHGARDAPVYRPQTPDLLPRPEAFERSYSQQRSAPGLRADDPLTLPGAGSALASGGTSGARRLRPRRPRPPRRRRARRSRHPRRAPRARNRAPTRPLRKARPRPRGRRARRSVSRSRSRCSPSTARCSAAASCSSRGASRTWRASASRGSASRSRSARRAVTGRSCSASPSAAKAAIFAAISACRPRCRSATTGSSWSHRATRATRPLPRAEPGRVPCAPHRESDSH